MSGLDAERVTGLRRLALLMRNCRDALASKEYSREGELNQVAFLGERALKWGDQLDAALDALAAAQAEAAAAVEERDALREALTRLMEAVEQPYSRGGFRNGVTDDTGSIDEGEVRMGERLAAARTLLATAAPEPAVSAKEPAIHAVALGTGRYVVNTGLYDGTSALFLELAPQPGVIGADASGCGLTRDGLVDGAIVVTVANDAAWAVLRDAVAKLEASPVPAVRGAP